MPKWSFKNSSFMFGVSGMIILLQRHPGELFGCQITDHHCKSLIRLDGVDTSTYPIPSMGLVYLPTFTQNINQMLANITIIIDTILSELAVNTYCTILGFLSISCSFFIGGDFQVVPVSRTQT